MAPIVTGLYLYLQSDNVAWGCDLGHSLRSEKVIKAPHYFYQGIHWYSLFILSTPLHCRLTGTHYF